MLHHIVESAEGNTQHHQYNTEKKKKEAGIPKESNKRAIIILRLTLMDSIKTSLENGTVFVFLNPAGVQR